MTKIFLIRHGQSEHNVQELISGHVNPKLTREGKAQARKTKEELAHIRFDEAYSSDLQRAIQTAEIIYGETLQPERQRLGLRERDFGSIDMKPIALFGTEHAKRQHLTLEENWNYKIVPDMESDEELVTRFIASLTEIAETHPDKTVLVVAHGGAIRTTLMKLQNKSYVEFPNGSFKNAGYVELSYDNGQLTVDHVVGVEK